MLHPIRPGPRLIFPALTSSQLSAINVVFNDNIQIEIGQIVVSAQAFGTLRPNEWLDDQVIDAYMSLLQKEGNKMGRGKFFVLPLHFFEALKENNPDLMGEYCSDLKMSDMAAVLVPTHVGRCHYALIVI